MSTCFFFFKQKTAYEMRISDWSSDVCSSDLLDFFRHVFAQVQKVELPASFPTMTWEEAMRRYGSDKPDLRVKLEFVDIGDLMRDRSEEHTSELQSLMRISYAVCCLKKKTHQILTYKCYKHITLTT